MSFLKSAINQVGRDMGKVVSNQIFKDSHSTPYRRVGNSNVVVTQNSNYSSKKVSKTEFDKAIEFQTSFKPNTLINKISGAFIVIKNETKKFIDDGYLDTEESNQLFDMMKRFNEKIEDVCDVLEIDESANEKELIQLQKIADNTNELFKTTLKISAEGCKKRQSELKTKAEQIEKPNFLKYVGLHFIWFGKFARGEEKIIWKGVIANIADIITFTFPITRIYLLLKGIFTYPSENKRVKKLINAHIKLAEIEGQRADAYASI